LAFIILSVARVTIEIFGFNAIVTFITMHGIFSATNPSVKLENFEYPKRSNLHK